MNYHKNKKEMLATGKTFRAAQAQPEKPKAVRPSIDVKAITEAAFKKAATDLKIKNLNKLSAKK